MKRIVVLLSFCCSLLVAMQSSAQFLSFDKVEYDFGLVNPNTKPSVTFSCTNRGTAPIVITRVAPSTENFTCTLTRDTLRSGDRAAVMITFDPKGVHSLFSEEIKVYTTDNMLGMIILTVKGTVKEIGEEIESQYPAALDLVRISKVNVAFSNVVYPETVVDTLRIYNPQDTALTVTFPNVPNYMTVQMYPETIQPNSSALLVVSYNSGIRKEWGHVSDKLYVGFKGKKINYKTKISINANITLDFSKMTKKELKNAPKIVFEQDTVNFGTVKQGDPVECKFNFENQGKTTLEILKIKTSCGCTAGTLDKTTYEKGEKGTVNVSLNTRNKREKTTQTITIISNDPKKSEYKIYIDGFVKTKE